MRKSRLTHFHEKPRYFVRLPDAVREVFKTHQIEPSDLLYAMMGDLDGSGNFYETYVAFDHTAIYTVSGQSEPGESASDKPGFSLEKFERFELDRFEDAFLVQDVYTARFCIRYDGAEYTLCRFQAGGISRFEKFRERLIKTKKGEPIDDTPLDEDAQYCPKCGFKYPEDSRKVCPNCINKFTVLKRLLKMYGDFKWQAVVISIVILLTTIFSFVSPYFSTKILYDDVLKPAGQFYGQVLTIVLTLLAIRLAGVILSMVYGMVSAHIAPQIVNKLRIKLFTAMQKLSLSFYTSKQTGSLMSRIGHDTDMIYGFFIDQVPAIVTNFITIIGLLIVMVRMQAYLTMFALVLVLVCTWMVRRLFKKMQPLYHKNNMAYQSVNAVVSDVFNGQRVVKAFAKEENEINRYGYRNQIYLESDYKARIGAQIFLPKVRVILRIGYTAIFYIGAILILSNHSFTLGTLTAFIAFANMLQQPVDFFMSFSDWWAGCVDASSRMFEILDAKPKIVDSPKAVPVETLRGDIELRNVSFSYDVGHPILKNVSFKIHAGQMFGIVGKTGAGKSTIISLITRLYDVNEGQILIDGRDIREIQNADLRRNIGVVSQETYLFIGTVADNIRYGKPDATMEEIINAAKASFAHDFIRRLPNGYDTMIGSGEVALSGGERQRLSIARAMLQRPSILILDEATASMDTQTERRIQYAIDSLKKGRTIISIAHRLSTLRDADILACIENGELAEIGTHEELIAQKGIYFELHKLQTEAFKFVEMGD